MAQEPFFYLKLYQNVPEYPQLCWGDEWPPLSPGRQPGRASGPEGGEGLPRGVIQNTPQGKGEGEMIL